MKNYSQSDEQDVILNHFSGEKNGIFLDVGAYDGLSLSNTRALFELGWSGVMVEPSPKCFTQLMNNYKDVDRVKLVNACIGDEDGLIEFYDSAGAVATVNKDHYEKWKDHQKDFQKIYIPSLKTRDLIKSFPMQFDFLSIDTEGNDWKILKEISLEVMKPSLICIESVYNSDSIFAFMDQFQYEPIHKNAENTIWQKI